MADEMTGSTGERQPGTRGDRMNPTRYDELRAVLFDPPDCPACSDAPCPDHVTQPGDDELGRALIGMYGGMVVARCASPRNLFRNIGVC